MKTVYIMRGPSGAGKSTYIKNNFKNRPHTIVSADHFFMKKDAEGNKYYDFNPALISKAHSSCMSKFLFCVEEGRECIIVDNTNIHLWEFTNYIAIAAQNGYKVEIIEVLPQTLDDLRRCVEKNSHKVPGEVIFRMYMEYEKFSLA